ncbi:MAG: hypothetical protein A2V88_08585 [Elusimicrobia bacterium RBG_16_66_12]|nr:MAG: hypothetical protein A2V88_08585 [Elusimicrobia bacterium RBG_16_66_12]
MMNPRHRTAIRRIPNTQLTKLVSDELIRYIKENRLRPGDRFPTEDQLCEQLGVSRTALREAMKRLEALGLVEAAPGRGRFITSPDLSHISSSISSLLLLGECSLSEVMEIRTVLETALAQLTASRATDEQLNGVQAAHLRIKEAQPDKDQALEATKDFHIAIAKASGNRLGEILVAATMHLTAELRRSHWAQDVDHHQLHQDLCDALLRKDPEAALKAMSEHFDATDRLTGEAA